MSITVTATQGGGFTNPGILLRVLVLDNATLPGTPNAVVQSGPAAHNVTVDPAYTGSLIYAVTINGNAGSVDAMANNTIIDGVLDTTNALGYGTFVSTATQTAGTNFVAGSPDSYGGGCVGLEIEPVGTIGTNASSPAVANTKTATTITTASFTPPAGKLMIALVSAGGLFGDVTTMAVTGGGLTWTAAGQANAASNFYAGIWYAFMPGVLAPPSRPRGQAVNRASTF